jgi:zinc transporter 1/2/3
VENASFTLGTRKPSFIDLTRSELTTRHGDCSSQQLACGAILQEEYKMPIHIGAVFIVLITSALGVLIPMVSGWVKRSDGSKIASGDPVAFGREAGVWASIFFLAKHFGTGIIISTAFIVSPRQGV